MVVRSCIVRAPNWIGDAVMALGGLREVRRIIGPDARLAVAARPWVAGIFEESGIDVEILPVERASWRDAIRLARTIRGQHFELAVLFQNAFEAALVARLARVPHIVGFATDGRRLLLTTAVPKPESTAREHETQHYMRLAAAVERVVDGGANVETASPDVRMQPRRETVEAGRALLESVGARPGTPLVVINPSATNSRAKQWPSDRFAAVADRLSARLGASVAIVGSVSERDVAMRVAGLMRSERPAAMLAGRTSVTELIGLLANATVLVSNDTGPAHLGAALGIATVTIFGPTEQFATHPIGPRAVVADHPVECSPCMLRDCPIDHRCMMRLEVDDVLHIVDTALRSHA